MNDLGRALGAIRDIRRQVAQTTEFQGYGPLTVFATAVLAVVAGGAQARWVPEPATHPAHYVGLWLTTAVVSAGMIATQMMRRADRMHRGMAGEMVQMAVLQFLPAALAGAVLPFVLLHAAAAEAWMLPGLWQVVFSLGVFASCRSMPRGMLLAGGWYLLTGLGCLSLGGSRALAPATMAVPYAAGMALVAWLHFHATRRAEAHDDEEG